MPHPLQQLIELGQSPWLDNLSRNLLDSGRLEELVRDQWITGLTSNPTIFRKAIGDSDDYTEQLREVARSGERDPYEAFLQLALQDIGRAADILAPVHERTGGGDGFASLELPPHLANDADGSVAEVERLAERAGRPNVMVKVPATEAGVEALRRLTAAGHNVNITLLFSVTRYGEIADAYVKGLEERLERGESLANVRSVASVFVSRIDAAVDPQLPEDSPLRGTAAIGNALSAYRLWRSLYSGPRWDRLAREGARSQDLLWGSTSTKDPGYSDVKYVEGLILPQTVNTMPEGTLSAFFEHGTARTVSSEAFESATEQLAALGAAGIDLDAVAAQLLDDGLQAFADDFGELLEHVARRLGEAQAA